MPPGSTKLVIRFEPKGTGTLLHLRHSGLVAEEAQKHAIGWPHFLDRLALMARGEDPGRDPWAVSPPLA
jgi:Activator of Hsp90 ATPase homolog 1-like protein